LTQGSTPPDRTGHTAVLSPDGSAIIVFGGSPLGFAPSLNDVWLLDVNTFTWSNPTPSGTPPQPRSFANSVLVGNQMLTMFGFNNISNAITFYSDVNVLDVAKMAWTTSFVGAINPTSSSSSSPTPASNSTTSETTVIAAPASDQAPNDTMASIGGIGGIIGIVAGAIVVVGIAVIIGFVYARKVYRTNSADPAVATTEAAPGKSPPPLPPMVQPAPWSGYPPQSIPVQYSPQSIPVQYTANGRPFSADSAMMSQMWPAPAYHQQSPPTIPEQKPATADAGSVQ